MNKIDRNTILDAIYILNDIFNDLIAGTMVFENYQSKFNSGQFSQPGIVAVQKMCISHLILGLNKICEFWKVYHHLVPDELKPKLKSLISELQKRNIKKIRNTVAAHIRDRKLKRSLSQSEVIELLNQISENDPSGFLLWLNNPNDYSYPNTVVSIVETIRDQLREIHDVTSDEVFKR